MERREFLKTSAVIGAGAGIVGCEKSPKADVPHPLVSSQTGTGPSVPGECCRTYASVTDAMQAPPETIAYVPCIYAGTGIDKPDYLATIDCDSNSKYFGTVIHRLRMPNVGDELHHFGWNACSSCHGKADTQRRFIVLPGITSSRIYIVDTEDPQGSENSQND